VSADGAVIAGAVAEGPTRSRPRHTILWSAVVVGVVVAILVAVLATRQSAANVEAGSPLLGKPAPTLAGADLHGHHVALTDFRGKYVLVNFFASWCVPCQVEQPELVRFAQAHRSQDAVLLGVLYGADPGAAPFLAKQGGTWPVIDDPTAQVDFGTSGVPETFLVDPNGIVLTRITGGVTDAGLEALVQLAERSRA
jgi:cytochrome c biogenesis protein CcmG/thiol:disulfide interchange protein DsbE